MVTVVLLVLGGGGGGCCCCCVVTVVLVDCANAGALRHTAARSANVLAMRDLPMSGDFHNKSCVGETIRQPPSREAIARL